MTRQDPIDEKLDYALEMTFPASDPFTIDPPQGRLERAPAKGVERGSPPAPAVAP